MTKASSFDVVSEVDLQEITNAADQAAREIATRFDFKDTDTTITQDRDLIEIRSSTEHRLKAALEVLKEKCVRRKVSLKALQEGPVQPGARSTFRQSITVSRGISQDKARELVKFVKNLGLKKVQTQVMGDKLRLSAGKKDDLQAAMGAIKEQDFGIPLQFTNYR
ncbi:MAG: YajQ family cyclic di-GMP-binding protein [Actinomycetota bacterium]